MIGPVRTAAGRALTPVLALALLAAAACSPSGRQPAAGADTALDSATESDVNQGDTDSGRGESDSGSRSPAPDSERARVSDAMHGDRMENHSTRPKARDTSARGRVRVVGAEPSVAVVLEVGGRDIALLGPLSSELANLDGAEVTITGSPEPDSRSPATGAPTWTVTHYTVDSIAGSEPVVGILAVRGRELWVDSTRLVAPRPPELERLEGAKVWVVGARAADGAMQVAMYGVLRRQP